MAYPAVVRRSSAFVADRTRRATGAREPCARTALAAIGNTLHETILHRFVRHEVPSFESAEFELESVEIHVMGIGPTQRSSTLSIPAQAPGRGSRSSSKEISVTVQLPEILNQD
jgi:hypothetical protein